MARQRKVDGPRSNRGLIDPQELDRLILVCQETDKYCAECERAGLDVGPERKKNADQLETCLKIKKVFFPLRV
jgi:hypothetical protein